MYGSKETILRKCNVMHEMKCYLFDKVDKLPQIEKRETLHKMH